MNKIEITQQQLDIDRNTAWLSASPQDGAIVTFIGKVRSLENQTIGLFLEHYPSMTEKVLNTIVDKARERWQLSRIAVIHRVGEIGTNEQIVFVGVSSAHRADAFSAAEFIMDVLKNEAPFWKKERTANGENWVAAKKVDQQALKKWY